MTALSKHVQSSVDGSKSPSRRKYNYNGETVETLRNEIDTSDNHLQLRITEREQPTVEQASKSVYVNTSTRGPLSLVADAPHGFLNKLRGSVTTQSVVIFMPSVNRSGEKTDAVGKRIDHQAGNLLSDNMAGLTENDIVLIFVERAQETSYKKALKTQIEAGTHVLIVLPDRWVARGAPVVREVMKLFAEEIHRCVQLMICIHLDDDTEKFTEYTSSKKPQELTARAALKYLQDILVANPSLEAVGLSHGQHARKKEYKNDNQVLAWSVRGCCAAFAYRIDEKTKRAAFACHRWLCREDIWWNHMKQDKQVAIQKYYFQREDYRFCAQIANDDGVPATARVVHVVVTFKTLPSQAGTKK